MQRWILHVDMDAFFPAVEQVLDSKLKGRPVIVGAKPTERGVVSSASYEARKFGVHAGMSSHQAGALCPHGVFVHGNHKIYKIYSDLIRDIFLRFTDQVEMWSFDEAFLDMTDCTLLYPDISAAGKAIEQRIYQETKLTCSVGIAATKIVAKVASDFRKPNGITLVQPGDESEFLAPMDIRDLPGIGPQSERQLRALGINKLGDIQRYSQKFFVDRWGKYGLSLWNRAYGRDYSRVATSRRQKSVSRERTFSVDTCKYQELEKSLAYLVEKSAYDLRSQGLRAKVVEIKVRYQDFTTISGSKRMLLCTDSTNYLLHQARYLFHKHYRRGEYVRLLGVGYSNFADGKEQGSVFDILERAKASRCSKLGKAVDNIRERFGFRKIRVLSSFNQKKK
ncbi:DNA polymerase IV [Patescibacteria group bacterium]